MTTTSTTISFTLCNRAYYLCLLATVPERNYHYFYQLCASGRPQPRLLSQPQLPQPQPQPQPQFPSRPQHQLELHSQPQLQYLSGYPPPPWAATPGYFSNPNPVSRPYAWKI
ncbi:unnamed protein product [Fraxinus pennsylvanica]|uniref:Uncharacterized protein n=1 Tax=Fraxinus pennsylvanica TaxID=56036 RepID=A0AAD1Z0C2_9LAMI|nr:unnamed protein product [Fraxinus pennsylvanica]